MTSKYSIAATAVLTLTIVLAPVQSKADDDGANQRFERAHKDCTSEDGLTAGMVGGCLLDKEKEYGKELERLYQRALRDDTINAEILRDSQRSWLNYQKQTCKAYERNEVGGVARLLSATCLLRTTLQRIDEFRDLLGDWK
jgi:uncharacterized protein YecT (DUF1311 family)